MIAKDHGKKFRSLLAASFNIIVHFAHRLLIPLLYSQCASFFLNNA